MAWQPQLVRHVDAAGNPAASLGHALVDDYLEFVAARCRQVCGSSASKCTSSGMRISWAVAPDRIAREGASTSVDTSTPPTNVTDAAVQGEVLLYLSSHAFDDSTIYEVFIPSSSYSSSGSSTSCGGPNLAYCAYHGHFSNGGRDIKYSIEPYPSCSGCHASGFNTVQDQEHFVCHETREAVTDPDLNAWFDRRGNEADDKCAWSPAPFIDSNGYGYQYEWSNAVSGCVQTR